MNRTQTAASFGLIFSTALLLGCSASSSATADAGPVALTSDEQMALDMVNAARTDVNDNHLYTSPGPHSTPLPLATWSPSIAALAQTWANNVITDSTCDIRHSGYNNSNNPGNLGEDLYAWTGDATGIFARAMQAFLDEKTDYNFDWTGPFIDPSDAPMEPMPFDAQSADSTPNDPTLPENQGKEIGHYTVIIWHDMTEFGCAYASKTGCVEVVCRFGPNMGINTLGVSPY